MIQKVEFHIHGMEISEYNGVFDVSLIIDMATGTDEGILELKSSSQTRVEAISDVMNQLKAIVKHKIQREDHHQAWTQAGEEP